VHEAEGVLKELMKCLKMQEKWVDTGLLKSLNASLRSMAETVLKVGACERETVRGALAGILLE